MWAVSFLSLFLSLSHLSTWPGWPMHLFLSVPGAGLMNVTVYSYYKCKRCNQGFPNEEFLRQHRLYNHATLERAHPNVETILTFPTYNCPHCDVSYTKPGNLKRHLFLGCGRDPKSRMIRWAKAIRNFIAVQFFTSSMMSQVLPKRNKSPTVVHRSSIFSGIFLDYEQFFIRAINNIFVRYKALGQDLEQFDARSFAQQFSHFLSDEVRNALNDRPFAGLRNRLREKPRWHYK